MKATTNIAEDHPVYDVIISGAGPVGLFLACELALAKCSVLLLEKAAQAQSPLKQLPFGIRGLSAPTIEALDRRGLLQELTFHKHMKSPHQQTAASSRRQMGHFAGIPFYEDRIDHSQWKYRLPGAPPASLISEMQELDTVLTRRAEALGVVIRRDTPVTNFHQAENDVQVFSGGQSFRSKWLVGCDGSRSVVRKIGGFEFAGTEPEFTGYTAKVEIADPEKLKPGRNLTATGMYMQSQPGYLMIQDFDGGAFHHTKETVTREHIQHVLRRISDTDVTISALHIATTWTDRARQATTYRHGQILLAGDAAHIHSPLGGQGLNLGIGDAMNLGWKLAATIQERAPEGLLDSYTDERHPVGEQVLDWSRAQVTLMRPEPAARALNAVFHDLVDTHDGASYIASRAWGVNIQYDLIGAHPLTGRSVPDFEFENGTRLNQLMQDGLSILLDFESDPALKKLADEYSGQIKYISARAKERFGLNALLIRPDGIVAWASENYLDHQELREAAERCFVSSGIRKEECP